MTLTGSGLGIPAFSWLPTGITLDAALTFAANSKPPAVSLDWKPLRGTCVSLFGELDTAGATDTTVDEIVLYGLVVDCQIAEGVRVRSATLFDPAKSATVTGQIDYFESLVLSGDLALCCCVPGLWSAATYFRSGSGQLSDWGMTLLKAVVVVSDHLSVRLTAAFRSGEPGDPVSELTIGWTACW